MRKTLHGVLSTLFHHWKAKCASLLVAAMIWYWIKHDIEQPYANWLLPRTHPAQGTEPADRQPY